MSNGKPGDNLLHVDGMVMGGSPWVDILQDGGIIERVALMVIFAFAEAC